MVETTIGYWQQTSGTRGCLSARDLEARRIIKACVGPCEHLISPTESSWLLAGKWLGANIHGCTPEGYMHFIYFASGALNLKSTAHPTCVGSGTSSSGMEGVNNAINVVIWLFNKQRICNAKYYNSKNVILNFLKFSVDQWNIIVLSWKVKPIIMKRHLCNHHNLTVKIIDLPFRKTAKKSLQCVWITMQPFSLRWRCSISIIFYCRSLILEVNINDLGR